MYWNWETLFLLQQSSVEQNDTSNNADWKRLHLSGDLSKNFNLYSYIYSHEGISWESFVRVWLNETIICHRSVDWTWSHCQEQWYRVHCTTVYFSQYDIFVQSFSASMIFSYSLFQPVWYFRTVCFSHYDIPQRSSQVELLMLYQWQVEAAWLNGTLWGQELLANWNLLLGTGLRRLCQKIIEKKGDLTISFHPLLTLVYVAHWCAGCLTTWLVGSSELSLMVLYLTLHQSLLVSHRDPS